MQSLTQSWGGAVLPKDLPRAADCISLPACSYCHEAPSIIWCATCTALFCGECGPILHDCPSTHDHVWDSLSACSHCTKRLACCECFHCKASYCHTCVITLHRKPCARSHMIIHHSPQQLLPAAAVPCLDPSRTSTDPPTGLPTTDPVDSIVVGAVHVPHNEGQIVSSSTTKTTTTPSTTNNNSANDSAATGSVTAVPLSRAPGGPCSKAPPLGGSVGDLSSGLNNTSAHVLSDARSLFSSGFGQLPLGPGTDASKAALLERSRSGRDLATSSSSTPSTSSPSFTLELGTLPAKPPPCSASTPARPLDSVLVIVDDRDMWHRAMLAAGASKGLQCAGDPRYRIEPDRLVSYVAKGRKVVHTFWACEGKCPPPAIIRERLCRRGYKSLISDRAGYAQDTCKFIHALFTSAAAEAAEADPTSSPSPCTWGGTVVVVGSGTVNMTPVVQTILNKNAVVKVELWTFNADTHPPLAELPENLASRASSSRLNDHLSEIGFTDNLLRNSKLSPELKIRIDFPESADPSSAASSTSIAVATAALSSPHDTTGPIPASATEPLSSEELAARIQTTMSILDSLPYPAWYRKLSSHSVLVSFFRDTPMDKVLADLRARTPGPAIVDRCGTWAEGTDAAAIASAAARVAHSSSLQVPSSSPASSSSSVSLSQHSSPSVPSTTPSSFASSSPCVLSGPDLSSQSSAHLTSSSSSASRLGPSPSSVSSLKKQSGSSTTTPRSPRSPRSAPNSSNVSRKALNHSSSSHSSTAPSRCPQAMSCSNPTRCTLGHTEPERRQFRESLRKMRLCRRWETSSCRHMENPAACSYAHGESDGVCFKCRASGHLATSCTEPFPSCSGNYSAPPPSCG